MYGDLHKIISQFSFQGIVAEIKPFGNGHINDTFLVLTRETGIPGYILQRKNHNVFKNVDGMMENIIRVTNHIRQTLEQEGCPDINRKVITHLPASDGKFYYRDPSGQFWVLMLFIEGCKNYEKIEKPEQACLAGKAFGHFQKQLDNLHGEPLNETIANFHNIEFRLENFQKAIKINYNNRVGETSEEICFALSLANEMKTLLAGYRGGYLPLRITHNDTKINNILFDQHGQILCIIDLDTVMPGLVHYDFGDAIRTAANTAEEDEPDLSLISVNLAIFEAFTKGFLEELRGTLSDEEKKLLAHSAKFMAYIMGLRFLTDYLEGDVYYKINHPQHNIQRARAQFKLVNELAENMEKMQETVGRYS